MKKQFMKPALFVAALAAVSLTSCEQKNEISGVPGETTDIAVGMSLALPVETKAATTPDDVNFGASVADIKNVTIVPMVGTTLQNPIVLGTFDADVQTTHYKTKEVPKTVDGFRVYGNMPSAADENKAALRRQIEEHKRQELENRRSKKQELEQEVRREEAVKEERREEKTAERPIDVRILSRGGNER